MLCNILEKNVYIYFSYILEKKSDLILYVIKIVKFITIFLQRFWQFYLNDLFVILSSFD